MNPKFFRNGIVMLALVVVALAVAITLVGQSTPPNDKAYSDFLKDVQAGTVTSIVQEGSKLNVTAGTEKYSVVVPGLLAQAYDDLYYLERACLAQVLAQSTGRPLLPVAAEIAGRVCEQTLGERLQSELFFEALRRTLP